MTLAKVYQITNYGERRTVFYAGKSYELGRGQSFATEDKNLADSWQKHLYIKVTESSLATRDGTQERKAPRKRRKKTSKRIEL